MRVSPLLAVIVALGVGGCAEKIVSLCSHSGGSCCAINYSYDSTGKPHSKVMSCRPSADACLAAAAQYGGTPDWNYTPDKNSERGQCEMVLKTVPIWEADSFATANATADLSNALKKLPDKLTVTGGTVDKTDPTYCRAACLTGDSGLCPIVPLPNDLALGLLSTTIDVVDTVTTTPRVFTAAEILRKFRVSASANACRRGDLIASDKAIINAAVDSCETDLVQATSAGNVPATLNMPQQLIAQPNNGTKTALWNQAPNAFKLTVNNAYLSPQYSGPVEVAGRTDVSQLFVKVRGSADIGCAGLTSNADREFSVDELSSAIEQDPAAVAAGLSEIASFRRSLRDQLAPGRQTAFDDLQVTGALFPYRGLISTMEEFAKTNGVNDAHLDTNKKLSGHNLTLAKVLRLLDINECAQRYQSASIEELLPLVPEIGDSSPPSPGLLSKRAEIAGEIIQCKLSSSKMTERAKSIIAKALHR
jgi:hypothetical protein